MEYIGYIAAIIIGISLGLIGAGGSILTIPVLVYLIGIPVVEATSYSLFIVGISALIGGLRYFKNNLISTRSVLVFGLPSIASIFITRKYLLHAIPDHLFSVGQLEVTKDTTLLLLLAVLMMMASYSMIKKTIVKQKDNDQYSNFLIFSQGIMVGILAGLVGAGGGFLIIPALVMFANLPMKQAIGTSLIIIALNSSIGFLSDFSRHHFDWPFLFMFSGFAITGIIIGSSLAKNISGEKLKPAFGWFIMVVGIYIVTKELFL